MIAESRKVSTITIALTALFLLMAVTGPVLADTSDTGTGDIMINLNGEFLGSDAAGVLVNGKTLVPVRMIAEELGADVSWEEKTQIVTIEGRIDNGNLMKISLNIGSQTAELSANDNSKTEKKLDAAPVIMNERTMVPVRFICETMGIDVNWDHATQTVYLKSEPVNTASFAQITEYEIENNNAEQAVLNLSMDKVEKQPESKVLAEDEPVFSGETKCIDPSLGKYRVELMFTDTRIADALQTEIGLETQVIKGENRLLQAARVAYPPDDSMMVLYLGCSCKPEVTVTMDNSNIKVSLQAEENGEQDVKVTTKEIKCNSEIEEVELKIPVIEGLKDEQVQTAINTTFENDALTFRNEVVDGLEEYVEECKKEGWPVRPYAVNTSYEVKYNDNEILSMPVTYYQYTGGAHGSYAQVSYNINLTTGKKIVLQDLFKTGADYKKIINREVNKQMKSDPDKYFADSINDFDTIFDEECFYIEKDGIVVYFGLYEIAPYCSGICEFKIPFALFDDGLELEFLSK